MAKKTRSLLKARISELRLSARAYAHLRRNNIYLIEDLFKAPEDVLAPHQDELKAALKWFSTKVTEGRYDG